MCIGRVLDDVWTTVTGHRSEQSPVIGPNRHQVSGETVASSVIWESPNTRTFQMSFPAVRDRYEFLSFGVLPEKCQYCISRCMDNSHQLRDKTGRRDLGIQYVPQRRYSHVQLYEQGPTQTSKRA